MNAFVFALEVIGAISFAVSGALTAMKKEMDIFGVCIMGLTTACGGGVIRDMLLGQAPPAMFREPVYALTAVITSVLVFLPGVRQWRFLRAHHFDRGIQLADALGLGIFTAVGVEAAVQAGYSDNGFFVIFLGAVTGVGGGVLRDVLAGDRPYIFVKHIYASASLAGAVLCFLLWNAVGKAVAMFLCAAVVVVIRLLAAHFRWSLPKAKISQTE